MIRKHLSNIRRQTVAGSLAAIVFATALSGCSDHSPAPQSEVLVRVGSRTLSRDDLTTITPAGLTPEDSVKFVKAYVTKWVDESLVSDIASEEVDLDRINRLVDDYRRELILREYTEQTFRSQASNLSEDTLRAFYDSHTDLFRLTQPMVRGTYIKISSDANNLRKIRRLYASDKADDADLLEKELLSDAIHYDYFRNRWIPWDQIESRIPYDFGPDSRHWAAPHRKLDFNQNGMTYLLYISEVIPTGSIMPFESARADISTRMLNASRSEYQKTMMRELLQRAITENRAEINI